MKKIYIVLASWPIREPLYKFSKTPSSYECMPDISFSVEGVEKQLLKIKINKSSGPDLIPARILRYAASELAVLRFRNSAISLEASQHLCIFYKGSKAAVLKNYRPVSLTSLSSKVIEHTVSWHISRHLSTNRIISQHQHGFQRWPACETTHHCHLRMGISPGHPRSNRCYISRFRKSFWFRPSWAAFT